MNILYRIEHLYPDTVENSPYNIFSYIKPKLVILTTPNSEFNVLFGGPPRFRHYDHKFEWTREQFEDWCNSVCERYPDYQVKYFGVGPGPEEFDHLGCCSQLGLFVRKDFLTECLLENLPKEQSPEPAPEPQPETEEEPSKPTEMFLNEENEIVSLVPAVDEEKPCCELLEVEPVILNPDDLFTEPVLPSEVNNNDFNDQEYRLIVCNEYPVASPDSRSFQDKILDEATYHIRRFLNMDKEYYNYDSGEYEIPLKDIMDFVGKYTQDVEDLKMVLLEKKLTVTDDTLYMTNMILIDGESEDSSYGEEDEYESEPVRGNCQVFEPEEYWE